MAATVDGDRFARVVEAFRGWSGAWAGELELVIDYLTRLPTHDEFAYLPALLPDSHRLPLSDMYVELRVSKGGLALAPHLLSDRVVDDWVEERRRVREKGRMSVEEALDRSPHRRFIILGDPGGGKSSLLRRIARDIAEQKWDKWTIPLHVSLPQYWRDKTRYPDHVDTLLDYACMTVPARGRAAQMGASSFHLPSFPQWARVSTKNLTGMLADEELSQYFGVVFLLDGLDEIAGNPEARDNVANNLQTLNSLNLPWIVASRRTGLFQDLGENIRYDILDLDRDGVEQLVGNWYRSLPEERCPDPVLASTRMVDELAAEPRLLSMARNPYLCMLLCYLRAQGDRALPTNRAAVYQAIIDAARRQLQHRANDETAFNRKDLSRLGALCHDLYGDTPRHLFSSDDWERLFDEPLTRQSVFLQSRLVDKWGDSESNYHLTHLTLHEYLIAWHLAQAGFDRELTEHLHDPPWRMVWRFLAARLWADGRHGDAVRLVRRLLEEIDLLGLVYVEAAHLLAEMDPSKASAMLGTDLIKHLWHLWRRHGFYIPDAVRAIEKLSPESCLNLLKEVIASSPRGGDETTTNAIRLLGEVRMPEARELLIRLFVEGDEVLAKLAGEVLANIDDHRLRRRILDLLDQAETPPILGRVVHLAFESCHHDYLPILLDTLSRASGRDLSNVCFALEPYASPQAFPFLIKRWGVCRDAAERASLARALVASCSPAGSDWLHTELEMGITDENEFLWNVAVQYGLVNQDFIASAISVCSIEVAIEIIKGIADFASSRGPVTENLWVASKAFLSLADDDLRSTVFPYLALIAATNTSLLNDADIALFVRAAGDPHHLNRADAANVVIRLDLPASDEIFRIAFDPSEDSSLRASIIENFAESKLIDGRADLLDSLSVLLEDPEREVVEAAAIAIAPRQLQILASHPQNPIVRDILARHCAERGILVFRDRIVGAR